MTPLPHRKTSSPESRLKAARTAANLSQVELARLVGVHPSTISLAERGGQMSPYLAARVAAVLGVLQ